EQETSRGVWETRQECLTIEFQTRAAQPHGHLVREHASPVTWDGDKENPPRLRLALLGVGQVRIERAALSDGRTTVPVRLAKKVLGQPAPKRGLPYLDWTRRQAVLPITVYPSPASP
ncbi:MAG: hypothetical protein JWM35_1355, partial [Verrucomicrobia bacterium]|nr:hypothetical protein [Verrucomicrobiota bacterium]